MVKDFFCAFLLIGTVLFASDLAAEANEVLQHIVPTISLVPPTPYRVAPGDHLDEPGDFHVGTASAKPIVTVSGTLNIAQNLVVGGIAGQPDIGSMTIQKGRVHAKNAFVGGFGGQGKITLKDATLSIKETISVGGARNGTGSLRLSGGVIDARQLSVGEGGAASVAIDGGEANIASVVFGKGSGTVTVNGGHLVTGAVTTSQTNHVIVLDGGTLSTLGYDSSDITGPGLLRIEEEGGTIHVGTELNIRSRIEGNGPLKLTGGGTLALSAENTYSGPTDVQIDTLVAGGTNALSPNSSVSLHFSSTLDLNGNPQAIGALSGSPQAVVINNGRVSANLAVGNNNEDGEYHGQLRDGTAYLSVHKKGTGTQILTGSNGYTAGTVIHEGIFQIGDGGTTGSIIGNIKNSGTFVINRSDESVFPGTIEGKGTFVKEGGGNLVLEGKNVYSGDTLIKSGTLTTGTANALSPNSNISMTTDTVLDLRGQNNRIGDLSSDPNSRITNSGTSNATLTVVANHSNGNFIGNIEDGSSSVSFNKEGVGTQILSGTNTYSAETTVSEGTLAQGAAYAFSANSNVVLKEKGTLDVQSHDSIIGSLSGAAGSKVTSTGTGKAVLAIGATHASGTFYGTLTNGPSSSLSINKVGTGTQIFVGENTNTGTMIISSGAIQLGSGGTTGSVASPKIQNDGALIINRKDILTLSGMIQGSGLLLQAGSGTTVLTGENNYTGGTTIDAGTLMGSTSSLQGNILNHSRLVFVQPGTGTFTGTISGLGIVVVDSPGGQVNFNSDQTYTGATIVENGAFFINGYLKSTTVQVTPNGRVGGKGTIGGNVINAGTIQGGNSPLALIITGNYRQDPQGALVTQLESETRYDRLMVEGKAELDGTLRVGLVDEYFPDEGTEFNILTATGSVHGTFSDLYLPPRVPLEIIYGDNEVRLLVPTRKPLQMSSNAPCPSEPPYIRNLKIHTGHLQINCSLRSDRIEIAADATLSGTGLLIGTLINSGVYSPGTNGEICSMVLNGNYVQNSTGTLVTRITGDNSCPGLSVTGSAQLKGTVEVQLPEEFVRRNDLSIPILIAEGVVTGTFSRSIISRVNSDQVSINQSNIQDTAALGINYTDKEVQLYIQSRFVGFNRQQEQMAQAFNATLTARGVEAATDTYSTTQSGSASDPDQTANNRNIARSSEGEFSEAAWAIAPLSPQEAAAELEQLAPLIVLNLKDIIFNAANTQYGQIASRLAAVRAGLNGVAGITALYGLPWEPMSEQLNKHEAKIFKRGKAIIGYLKEPSRWGIFASASGVFSRITNPHDLPRVNSIVGYFCAGADCRMNDYINLGSYVGYQGFKGWYSNRAWLRSNGVKFGLYGTAQWNGFYLNTIVGGGANFVNMNRPIKYANCVARSYPFAGELNSLLGGGYEWNLGPWRFGVNNSIQYTYLGVSSFQESGAGTLNVRGGPHNPSSLMYSLGANVAYSWQISPGYQILPTIGLSWQHEFLNYGQGIRSAFANGLGAPFYVYTFDAARNNAFGNAGLTAQLGRHTAISAFYTPQFGGNQIVSHGVLVSLSYHF
ncbi:MAG: hypothetical protein C5B47_08330 [Verrucomicrobia bacterium]|nr:MAG: hypothetical protein C5B47_08330 [Verrucomicrobiota bacterium]